MRRAAVVLYLSHSYVTQERAVTEFLKIWDESCQNGEADYHGAAHILDLCLKTPDYTRELYQQLLRETDINTANGVKDMTLMNTWKLLYIVTAVVPPVDVSSLLDSMSATACTFADQVCGNRRVCVWPFGYTCADA
jgi:hypothetical protein